MLARKNTLRLNDIEIGTTPMLVPSFSSRANYDVCKTLDIVEELINDPILVSAYDIHHTGEKFPEVTFPTLVFIDSGGYECAKNDEISELGVYWPDPKEWNTKLYLKTINNLGSYPPKVVVSYDHPTERFDLNKQIEHANDLFRGINGDLRNDGFLKEVLIKPGPENTKKVRYEKVMQEVEQLSQFDILGFTEKELGSCVLDRMIAIANIRKVMDDNSIAIPIHIFGSLDPITTPLYYMSGADIFDGLSWLRFMFSDGQTLYLNSFGPRKEGIHVYDNNIWVKNLTNNYDYIRDLGIKLERFHSTKNFNLFGTNEDFMRDSYEILKSKVGGGI